MNEKFGSEIIIVSYDSKANIIFLTFQHFHIDHNAPCLLLCNFTKLLFLISPGHYSRPKTNRKQ